MSDLAQKIVVALVSATISGGITILGLASNWTGRLQAVEQSLTRIELRLDALQGGRR